MKNIFFWFFGSRQEKDDYDDIYEGPFSPVIRKDENAVSFLIQPLNRDYLAVQAICKKGGEIEHSTVKQSILLYSKGNPLGFYYRKRFHSITKKEFVKLFPVFSRKEEPVVA